MDTAFAKRFADEWVTAWNTHNLPAILAHYADDFEMSSPMIARFAGEPSCLLKGKAAVGAYWEKALQLLPNLHFELISVLVGVNSVTLYYHGATGGKVAEVFHFNDAHLVAKAFAHYEN
jgi:ketosteroid isomerase-like protein